MKFKLYFDEAGRGPLAGPVLVGCVLPLDKFDSSLFKDSKKLSEKKREEIFLNIKKLESEKKLFFSFGYSSSNEIDNFGIKKAINIATKRAIILIILKYLSYLKENEKYDGDSLYNILKLADELEKSIDNEDIIYSLDFKYIFTILQNIEKVFGLFFDGNTDFGLSDDLGFKVTTIIKGDNKIPFIGAASIVAKVIRDDYMKNLSKEYSKYLFERHKGYGTKQHRDLIKKYGPCSIHRKTFLKNILLKGK